MKITVLLGGTSAERDVSLASGIRIVQALRSVGHEVSAIDPASGPLSRDDEQALMDRTVVQANPPSLEELARLTRESLPRLVTSLTAAAKADVVFLGLHGGAGEDGTVQSLLDVLGARYTGSGHLASAMAMDKQISKRLFRDAGVQTADWLMAPATKDEVAAELGFPVIVKPSKQGSTVGLSVVKKPEELDAAIAEAYKWDDEVMIERFIAGRELTVAVVDGDALPVGEIIPEHELYDYECKYTAGMAKEVFPAEITKAEAAEVQEQARRAFGALKLRGCARVDFRMAPPPDGGFYCLEANTLPGMTNTSLVPQAAVAAGIDFAQLCDRIVKAALG
jgi:D-alanine-D-alanine ligase